MTKLNRKDVILNVTSEASTQKELTKKNKT